MASEASSSSTAMAPPRSLADMPKAWLQQLMLFVRYDKELRKFRDRDALWRSLSETCKILRELALRYSPWTVNVGLNPPTPENIEKMAEKLAVACKYSGEVCFTVDYPHGHPGQQRVSVAETDAHATALLHAAMARGAGLESIMHVYLDHATVEDLLPPWHRDLCPNVRRLQFYNCNFDGLLPPATATIPARTRLQSLYINQHNQTDEGSSSMSAAVWAQQLRALPNLEVVLYDVETYEPGVRLEAWPDLLVAFSTIGSQLTSLMCLGATALQPQWQLLPTWFPRIHTLEMSSILVVNDEVLEVLLSMRTLRALLCHSLQLQRSYTQRVGRWEQLGFVHIDIASLARLPLDSLQSLLLLEGNDEDYADVVPSADLAECSRAAAAVARCGGFQTPDWKYWWCCLEVRVLNCHSRADSACLEAVLPMLSTIPWRCGLQFSLRLEGVLSITPQLLGAMGQHLLTHGLPRFDTIGFHHCTWQPEAWPCLLPSLPNTAASSARPHYLEKPQVSLVCTPGQPTEAQLTEACVHATSPARLTIIDAAAGQLEEGWKERVQAAMTAAGHQHVILEEQD